MTDFGKRKGDMEKSEYDTDDSGVVDDSEALEGDTEAEVQDHTPKAHTHDEADITDLAHDALSIAGKEVDDSAIGDQKTLAYDDGSGKIIYITPAPSGAVVDNIQTGTVTVANASTTGTATITSVDTSKALLILAGIKTAASALDSAEGSLTLTNATTVTVTRASSAGAIEVNFFVIEFSAGVTIQHCVLEITTGNTVGTYTITSVDTSKTALVSTGCRPRSPSANYEWSNLTLTNATTVTGERNTSDGSTYHSFNVLEFD